MNTASPTQTTGQSRRRTTLTFVILSVLLVTLSAANLLTGDSGLSATALIGAMTGGSDHTGYAGAILSLRITRIAVAATVGAALSVGGLLMQTMFRNPLADPYILGVSSGASLGAAVLMLGLPLLGLGTSSVAGSLGVAGAAWAGAALVLIAVGMVSRWVRDILGVLIVGVMFGYVAGAIIQVLQYLSSAESLKLFTLWSMGSTGSVTVQRAIIMAVVVAAGLIMATAHIKSLNLMLLGEDYARSMGLDTRRTRLGIFAAVTLLAGTTTAFCGPVGFVGLAVPHITRMMTASSDHRVMLPATLLAGIDVMLACDIMAKTLVLPINSITALMGVPVILWVIFKNMRRC